MNKKEIEDIEIDLLLEAIKRQYDYDFNNYAKASIKRRIKNTAVTLNCDHISDLIPKVLHDREAINVFLKAMSVTVTDMFRDPWVFKIIRENVLPAVSMFPQINIWHAGCATGEEVYSMAIMLHEADLLDYVRIYATDFNHKSLGIAQQGIYPLEHIKRFTSNYIEAGGGKSFSDYYDVEGDQAKFIEKLKENIVFTSHNLVEDNAFGEMNIVMCRNVLIYFQQILQNKALGLFIESLLPGGFLVLGDKESIDFSDYNHLFDTFSKREKIYRMKS